MRISVHAVFLPSLAGHGPPAIFGGSAEALSAADCLLSPVCSEYPVAW